MLDEPTTLTSVAGVSNVVHAVVELITLCVWKHDEHVVSLATTDRWTDKRTTERPSANGLAARDCRSGGRRCQFASAALVASLFGYAENGACAIVVAVVAIISLAIINVNYNVCIYTHRHARIQVILPEHAAHIMDKRALKGQPAILSGNKFHLSPVAPPSPPPTTVN